MGLCGCGQRYGEPCRGAGPADYPHKAPGLTAQLRRSFGTDTCVGIELEVNQSIVFGGKARWTELRGVLTRALIAACAMQ
jgi:hypothetical protein